MSSRQVPDKYRIPELVPQFRPPIKTPLNLPGYFCIWYFLQDYVAKGESLLRVPPTLHEPFSFGGHDDGEALPYRSGRHVGPYFFTEPSSNVSDAATPFHQICLHPGASHFCDAGYIHTSTTAYNGPWMGLILSDHSLPPLRGPFCNRWFSFPPYHPPSPHALPCLYPWLQSLHPLQYAPCQRHELGI